MRWPETLKPPKAKSRAVVYLRCETEVVFSHWHIPAEGVVEVTGLDDPKVAAILSGITKSHADGASKPWDSARAALRAEMAHRRISGPEMGALADKFLYPSPDQAAEERAARLHAAGDALRWLRDDSNVEQSPEVAEAIDRLKRLLGEESRTKGPPKGGASRGSRGKGPRAGGSKP